MGANRAADVKGRRRFGQTGVGLAGLSAGLGEGTLPWGNP